MRLIDADELKVEVKKALLFSGDFMAQASVTKAIEQAPTVDQWHYPSKGELPPMDTKVYLWTEGDEFPVVARRHDFHRSYEEWSWDCYWGSGFEIKADFGCIVAWQHITPPKEEE